MVGLVPTIHVGRATGGWRFARLTPLHPSGSDDGPTWMVGTRPTMTGWGMGT